jgi:hypothetical protein
MRPKNTEAAPPPEGERGRQEQDQRAPPIQPSEILAEAAPPDEETFGAARGSALAQAAAAAGFEVLRYACTDPKCVEVTETFLHRSDTFTLRLPAEAPCCRCGGTVRRFQDDPSEVESERIPWGRVAP